MDDYCEDVAEDVYSMTKAKYFTSRYFFLSQEVGDFNNDILHNQ